MVQDVLIIDILFSDFLTSSERFFSVFNTAFLHLFHLYNIYIHVINCIQEENWFKIFWRKRQVKICTKSFFFPSHLTGVVISHNTGVNPHWWGLRSPTQISFQDFLFKLLWRSTEINHTQNVMNHLRGNVIKMLLLLVTYYIMYLPCR